jgi:5-methylthioadenosine/S-adenosylhomocysteine deaminase
MREAGLKIGLGTDGAASNNNLNMFEELQLAALLPKGILRDARALPAREALSLATSAAAEALCAPHIGSLSPGKRADIIVVDLRQLHLAPRYSHKEAIYSHLVYSAQAADVRDTMIEGRMLMRDRKLLTLDERALCRSAQSWVENHE